MYQVAVVQWLYELRTHNLREPGFESCAAMSSHGQVFFTLHWSSSLNCMNDDLAEESSG